MRKTYFYIRIVDKPYSFGKSCTDLLSARITLDRAMHVYPNEQWHIVQICA